MVSRSDTQTLTKLKQVFYSDFADSFQQSPFSGDLAIVTNENSVKQSLRNIVSTIAGDRPYDNQIGRLGDYQQWELINDLSGQLMANDLKKTITQNEPRIQLLDVLVNPNPTNEYYIVSIYFYLVNNPQQLSLDVLIKRVR